MDSDMHSKVAEGEFDFRKFSQNLSEKKKSVLAILLSCMGIAVLVGWLLGTFVSVGYFQFGMSLPDFKKLQSSMAAPGRWDQFLITKKNVNQSDFTDLRFAFSDENAVQRLITPVYPLTKIELKELPESANKDATAGITAIKVSFKAETPIMAQSGVLLIGDFLRDTAILMNYRETVETKYADYLSTERKYENNVIEIKYQLRLMEIRKAGMQKILHDYPESTKSDSRQLVSISEGSTRFLSPITQLVAIESAIMEQTQILPKILRDQHANSLYLRYYEKILLLIDKSTSGDAFLRALAQVRESLMLNLNDEVEKTVDNNIALESESAQNFYFKKIRFIGQPTKPYRRSPSLAFSIIIGLLGGIFVGTFYILFIGKMKINPIAPFISPKSNINSVRR
jgi:hypothetical protein